MYNKCFYINNYFYYSYIIYYGVKRHCNIIKQKLYQFICPINNDLDDNYELQEIIIINDPIPYEKDIFPINIKYNPLEEKERNKKKKFRKHAALKITNKISGKIKNKNSGKYMENNFVKDKEETIKKIANNDKIISSEEEWFII
jgi:hypothetical protein